MCKPTAADSTGTSVGALPPQRRRRVRLLLTTESFHSDCGWSDFGEKKEENKILDEQVRLGAGAGAGVGGSGGGQREKEGPAPSMESTLFTLAVLVGFLWGTEMAVRWLLERFQHMHPLLTVELNRQILARHLGVDVLGCAFVSSIALANRSVMADMIPGSIGDFLSILLVGRNRRESKGKSPSSQRRWSLWSTVSLGGYESRLFTYHPAGQRVLLFFFAYQTKNMVDTLIWNDGIVFVLHHILSGAAAWGGMYPGCAHYYAIFYMGISEISTAFLCLLANFDDEFGVAGLGDAFPLTRVALGAVFAVTFVVCRAVLWPYVTYHFVRDAKMALGSDGAGASTDRSRGRGGWIRLFVFCCAGLTLLQAVWLVQIVVTARDELRKLTMQ